MKTYRIIRDVGRAIGYDTLVVTEHGSQLFFTHLDFIQTEKVVEVFSLEVAKTIAEILGNCAVLERSGDSIVACKVISIIGSWRYPFKKNNENEATADS